MGASGTATTLVLHEACRTLASGGVHVLTLGGGATSRPMTRYSASSGAGRTGGAVPHRRGVFDPVAHQALVEEHSARPLPTGAVRP